MFVSVVPDFTVNSETDANGFTVDDNGVLTGYTGSATDVVIPETVTSIANSVFGGNSVIRTVVIPDTVTAIGNYSFSNCANLESITLSKKLVSVGREAFANNPKLSYVSEIPATLTSVYGSNVYNDQSVFYNTPKLTTIALSNELTAIPGYLFYGSNITSVSIPESVTSIGSYAFKNCDQLTEVTIPDSVTEIKNYAFDGCAKLERITLSKKLVSVGREAFANNPELSYVSEIPATLTSVYGSNVYNDQSVFYNTPKLTTVAINDELAVLPAYIFQGSNITSIDIPDSVTEIGYYAFDDCKSLSSVKLSNALYKVGNYTFRGCSALTDIKLPSSLAEIGKYTFADTGLTSITIPKPARNLGDYMFENCTALASVTLAPKQTKMNYAFVGCTALTDITIPDTVTDAKEAFANSGLKNVTFVDEKGGASARTTIPSSMFNKAKVLGSIELPETVTTISDHAFYGASALNDIKLPDGLLTIDEYAFEACTSLAEIELPDSLTTINKGAFQGATALTNITIPDLVNSLGTYVFSGCTALESAVLPDILTTIPSHEFYNCSALTTVNIPAETVTIKESAFENCAALDNVKFNDKLTGVDSYAFKNADSLSSVSLPESVEYIGNEAFNSCDSLKSVSMIKVRDIGKSAFYDCKKLADIDLGKYVGSVGTNAFRKLPKLKSLAFPSGLSSIPSNCATECLLLEDIYIPYSVTTINANPFSYSDNVTIHCAEGSAAETFADDNDYEYVTDEFKQEVNYTVYPADTWFTASWDKVEGADSYEILIFSNKDNTCVKLISGITDTAYKSEQNTLDIGATYKFVVRPCVNGKYSTYSLTEATTVTLYKNPGNVFWGRIGNITDNTIELYWGGNSNTTGYDVYVLNEKNAEWKLFQRVTENKCTITGLRPGTEYNFRVVPVKSVEAGDIFGNPWETSAKTTGEAVISPVITKTVPDDSSVTITWGAVSGAEKYNVFSYINGKYTLQGSTTTTTFTVKNLVNGAKYGFLVRAYINGQWTAFTADDIVYATPVATKPVVTTKSADSSVVLSWNKISIATNYNVFTYVDGKYYAQGTTTANTFTVKNLTNGKQYGFLVRAYVNGKWTAFTANDVVYATPAATKPVITAKAGDAAVTLTWGAVGNATNYSVFTYVDGKYYSQGTTTANTFTVKNLTNGQKYGFLVRALVGGKWTAFTVADVVYATPVSSAVKPVVTVKASDGAAALSWDPVAGATSYYVYTYLGGKYTAQGTTTSCTYAVKGLVNGTRYGFLVRAMVGGKLTAFTNADVVYATPVGEAKPKFTVTAGDGSAEINWNAVSGATEYSVFTYLDGKYTARGTTKETSFKVNGLVNGTKYGFLVRAMVGGKWSAFTVADVVYATPVATKPVITNAKPGDGLVTINWSSITGAARYNVYTYVNGKYYTQGTTTETTYTIKDLTNGTRYGFLVRAYVNGTWSSFTTDDVVYATPVSSKPVVSARPGDGSVVLSWTAPSSATNFAVYSYLGGKYYAQGTTSETTFTVNNLTNGTNYGFLVRAYVNGAWTSFTVDDVVYATPQK